MQAWLAAGVQCCAGSAAYVLVLSAGLPSANSHLQTDPGHQSAPSPPSRALPGHVGTSSGRALSPCKHMAAPASFWPLQLCYHHSCAQCCITCCRARVPLLFHGITSAPSSSSGLQCSQDGKLNGTVSLHALVSCGQTLSLDSAAVHGPEDIVGVC